MENIKICKIENKLTESIQQREYEKRIQQCKIQQRELEKLIEISKGQRYFDENEMNKFLTL